LLRAALTLFLFAGLIIMLSAGGAVASNQLHLPRGLGIGLLALATLGACWWRTESLVRVNAVATPLLVAVMAATALPLLARSPAPAAGPPGPVALTAGGWWWAALLYTGYNLLAGAAVLPALSQYGPQAGRGALVGGLVVGGLAALGAGALARAYPGEELPLLAAARSLNPTWAWIYALNLALALWTTAAGHLFGLASGAPAYRARLVGTLLLALPPAFLPFPALVGNLYPLFGYLGLLLMASLVLLPP
jgi:uncharacterized membrane protein YkvI